jgi:type I restriction enzyme S subunit
MSAFPVKSLNDLIESGVIQLTRGKIISRKDIAACPGSYPIYSSARDNDGKFGEYGKYLFDEELITWSVDGGGRLFHRPKHRFSVTNVGGVLRICDPSVICYRFLYYALTLRHSEISFDWVKKAHPSVIRKLYTDIPLPPIPEQQRIVALLDEVFAGLSTAKANAEQNLQNARALIASHLEAVFSRRGEGWVEKRLDEVCAISSTLVDPRNEEFLDLTHVGAGNIESKTGALADLMTARQERLISGKFYFDKSMVLYSKIRPYLMKAARPAFEGLCSADIYPLSPFPGVVTRDYLFHLLLSKHFTDYAIQGSARAGMPKVNREHLFGFRDVRVQSQLAAKLDALNEETQRLTRLYERKLAALEELKKSLLHQAFNGEL